MEEASKHWNNVLRALERTLPASRLSWRAVTGGGGGGEVAPLPSPAPVPRASPTANKSLLEG